MTTGDTIGSADLRDAFLVGRKRVNAIVVTPGFPKAVIWTGTSFRYDRAEVLEWIRIHRPDDVERFEADTGDQ